MGLKMENNEDALKNRLERSSSQYDPLNFLTHFDFKMILKRILPTDRGAPPFSSHFGKYALSLDLAWQLVFVPVGFVDLEIPP